jgi:hypothetical protein
MFVFGDKFFRNLSGYWDFKRVLISKEIRAMMFYGCYQAAKSYHSKVSLLLSTTALILPVFAKVPPKR